MLKEIISGWSNYVFPSEEIEQMAMERAKVCSECEHVEKGLVAELIGDRIEDIEGLVCGLCHCPLSGLLRSEESKCKIDKWKPYHKQ